ncbi:unnamed protein product [Caenorhabditis auriculariae]|uniref:Ubiquitin-like protease family profile domain-containing protein n=1 Tax=Caenorhabditis auriculariae TaxID=2777116 RepID=A0A8S1H1H6_9PELO|nr:unnamed protein product [Caenorhabditis auriculariae]
MNSTIIDLTDEDENKNIIIENRKRVRLDGRVCLDNVPRLFDDHGFPLKLNDDVINFFLGQYLPKYGFAEQSKKEIAVFDTYFMSKLRRYETDLMNDENYDTLYKEIHRNGETRPLEKNVLVIPCHYEIHWFLIVIHNPLGLVLSKDEKIIDQELKNEDEDLFCRIMFMDSLMKDPKNQAVLTRIHERTFDLLRNWLIMIFSAHKCVILRSRISMIRCSSLPQQKNNVDCGLFVLAYAEVFLMHKYELWTKMQTSQLKRFKFGDEFTRDLHNGEIRKSLSQIFQLLSKF